MRWSWLLASVAAVGASRQTPFTLTEDLGTATTGTDDTVHAWSLFSLKAFPKHSIRVREESRLCDPDVKQYVGYLDVDDEHDKSFFFWFFESRSNPAKDPLTLWLNGGPGCSSLTGLFMELGPCRVNPKGNGTTYNEHGWNAKSNLIFLDQPVNVGFSYSNNPGPSTTDEAAEDVHAFLQLFLSKFTKYAKAPFHVFGESYAGHYIPAIGHAIQENARVQTSEEYVHINLKSLGIGNGLIDPATQYQYYPDMACDTKCTLLSFNVLKEILAHSGELDGPVLQEGECERMRESFPTCKRMIDSCYAWKNRFSWRHSPGSIYCNNNMIGPFQKTGLNIYDIRKKCDPNSDLCYPILKDIEAYLNSKEVQSILGVNRKYVGCNMEINKNFLFAGDWMRPYHLYLPPILESGIRVLIYAGDADFICNWIGNKAFTKALKWKGQKGFQAAPDLPYLLPSKRKSVGEMRVFGDFVFLNVYEAGHMVPYDQPEVSAHFFNTWISAP